MSTRKADMRADLPLYSPTPHNASTRQTTILTFTFDSSTAEPGQCWNPWCTDVLIFFVLLFSPPSHLAFMVARHIILRPSSTSSPCLAVYLHGAHMIPRMKHWMVLDQPLQPFSSLLSSAPTVRTTPTGGPVSLLYGPKRQALHTW